MVRIFHVNFSTRAVFVAIVDLFAISLMVLFIFYQPVFFEKWNEHTTRYLLPGILLLTFWLWTLYTLDLYDTKMLRSPRVLLQRTATALGIVSLIGAIVLGFTHDLSRTKIRLELLIISYAVFSITLRSMVDWFSIYWGTGERLLVIGSKSQMRFAEESIRNNPVMRVQTLGLAEPCTPPSVMSSNALHLETELRCLNKLVQLYRPNRIIVQNEVFLNKETQQSLLHLRAQGISINTADELYEMVHGKVPVSSISAMALMYGAPFHGTSFLHTIYHFINMLLALLIMLVLLPVGVLISLAIIMESWGPIFYSQERVGFRGKPFHVIKFRSMRVDAENNTGPIWASKKDPRITHVGSILRKLRLDEIPQLWNVLRGEMNLVGPRPERPHFVNILRNHIPFYDLRHSVLPGITGWAQVMAAYGDSIESSLLKVEYDIFYLQRASISFDMYILLRTIKIALWGRGSQ
jgi:exopolysaccharide biosynthesis polyprenyl glycosylphosphotransferase